MPPPASGRRRSRRSARSTALATRARPPERQLRRRRLRAPGGQAATDGHPQPTEGHGATGQPAQRAHRRVQHPQHQCAGHRWGTCFGDSGGPIFTQGTSQIVAVNSFVLKRELCRCRLRLSRRHPRRRGVHQQQPLIGLSRRCRSPAGRSAGADRTRPRRAGSRCGRGRSVGRPRTARRRTTPAPWRTAVTTR